MAVEAQRWTQRKVLDLAPDQASITAARRLAQPGPWSGTGTAGTLVWGRCQGSGSAPYEVSADTAGPSTTCSCPSRKTPCKHAIALLLLWSSGQLGDESTPAARRHAPTTRARQEPPDEDALAKAARRRSRRIALMTDGLAEHDRWMEDLIRGGLAAARLRPYAYWDAAAARLVDAQVGGLAEEVRDMPGIIAAAKRRAEDPANTVGWAEQLLVALGRWTMLTHAWRHLRSRTDLTAPTAAAADRLGDVRAALGWAVTADERRGLPSERSRWVIVGVRRSALPRVVEQRTHLVSPDSSRHALLLDFAGAGGVLQTPQTVGTIIDATVVAYPGSEPQRLALLDGEAVGRADAVPGAAALGEALASARRLLAANPLRTSAPLVLADVRIIRRDGGLLVRSADGRALEVVDTDAWAALAAGGGGPVDVFAELVGTRVRLLSAAIDGEVVPLPSSQPPPTGPRQRPQPEPLDLSAARSLPGWDDLVAQATLGTSRRTDLPPLPLLAAASDPDRAAAGVLAERLTPERRLLRAAAVYAAAERAAATAHAASRRVALRDDDLAPDDAVPAAPPRAARVLELILAPGPVEPRDVAGLLAAWCRAATAVGVRMPTVLVPSALRVLSSEPRSVEGLPPVDRRPGPAALGAAIGARGRWLAAAHAGWAGLISRPVAAASSRQPAGAAVADVAAAVTAVRADPAAMAPAVAALLAAGTTGEVLQPLLAVLLAAGDHPGVLTLPTGPTTAGIAARLRATHAAVLAAVLHARFPPARPAPEDGDASRPTLGEARHVLERCLAHASPGTVLSLAVTVLAEVAPTDLVEDVVRHESYRGAEAADVVRALSRARTVLNIRAEIAAAFQVLAPTTPTDQPTTGSSR